MKLKKRSKLVHGVGINDADYQVYTYDSNHKAIWRCPFYSRWTSVLERCYSKRWLSKHPSYKNCTIDNEWIYFSKFKAWMETQDWEGKDLDKDILIKGNRIYSADTCVFVDQKTNKFLTDRSAARGEYPIGVSLIRRTGKFLSSGKCAITGKQKHIGIFDNTEAAHLAWLKHKLEQAYIIAEAQTDKRVAEAIVLRFKNY